MGLLQFFESSRDRARRNLQYLRQLVFRDKRVCLQVLLNLNRQGVRPSLFFRANRLFAFGIYSATRIRYLEQIVSVLAKLDNLRNAFLCKVLNDLQTLGGQVVALVPPESEAVQTPDTRNLRICQLWLKSKPLRIQRRTHAVHERPQVVKLVELAARLPSREREKSVAVVEDWRGPDNLVRVVVDQIAKVPHVPIRVEDQGVEKENVGEARVGKGLFARDQASRREIAELVAREERTRRAEASLEHGKPIRDEVESHRLGELRGIEFRIRLEAGVQRAGRP